MNASVTVMYGDKATKKGFHNIQTSSGLKQMTIIYMRWDCYYCPVDGQITKEK